MSFPAAQNSVVSAVPPEAIGKASGVNSTMRELGGVFGIALSVAVFAGAGATPRRPSSPTASAPRWASRPGCRCSPRSRAPRSRGARAAVRAAPAFEGER